MPASPTRSTISPHLPPPAREPAPDEIAGPSRAPPPMPQRERPQRTGQAASARLQGQLPAPQPGWKRALNLLRAKPELPDDAPKVTRGGQKAMARQRDAQKTNRLGEVHQQLLGWEAAHQVDKAKILRALHLIAEGYEEKAGLGERSGKYGEATTLMREGLGIDADTFKRAKHTFGMQGLADVYDSAATTMILGPALAAVGASELGTALSLSLKYVGLALVTPLSNGAGQIVVDAYQDTIVKLEGVPVAAGEINRSPKMTDTADQIGRKLAEVNALRADYADAAKPAAERNEALAKLQTCAKELDELRLGYRKRVARGLSNFVKYETQIVYKAVTAPAVVAAAVYGGPLAGWAAGAAQQAAQAPFGYLDEILLKDHIMRFNTKYADVLTDDAKKAGKTRDSADLQAEDIDEAKVRRLWSRPLDVVNANVAMVYTDELATRLRDQTKLEKHHAALAGATPGELEASRKRIAAGAVAIDGLKADILAFRDGQWRQLSPSGSIANMLLSAKEHFRLLNNAKFRRPGEYTAQVLDRAGGLVLPRAVAGGLGDGFDVAQRDWPGEGEAIAAAGIGQAGVLAGNAVYNPITKFEKQTKVRGDLVRPKVGDGAAEGPLMRRAFGAERAVTDGPLQPVVSFGPEDNPITIDLRETRAWMNHSNSTARIIADGVIDTTASLGTHLGAAVALPVTSAMGAVASRRAAAARERILGLEPVALPPELELEPELEQELKPESELEFEPEPKPGPEPELAPELVTTSAVATESALARLQALPDLDDLPGLNDLRRLDDLPSVADLPDLEAPLDGVAPAAASRLPERAGGA